MDALAYIRREYERRSPRALLLFDHAPGKGYVPRTRVNAGGEVVFCTLLDDWEAALDAGDVELASAWLARVQVSELERAAARVEPL